MSSSSTKLVFPASTIANPKTTKWQFTWEAQSHTSILRLILFNPNLKPRCVGVSVNLFMEQSLLTVEVETGTLLRVRVPRVLIDPEVPVNCRTFDDHIEVKVSLLLPVDHPLVLDLDLHEPEGENSGNCSTKLTKGIRLFNEMPSVDWQDVADNWFGTCCCSFGGISEKLVMQFAKSYSCIAGVCLITGASVIICKEDLIGCEFPEPKGYQTYDSQMNSAKVTSLTPRPEEENVGVKPRNEVSEMVIDDDSSTCIPSNWKNEDKMKSLVGSSFEVCQIRSHDNGCCTNTLSERFPKEKENEMNTELLEKQKIFLKGCLGDAFMLRHSNLSKDVKWIEFLCPKCSSLIGSYPCSSDNAPLDDGVRLYKFNISTCLPVRGLNDLFREYTLERMFSRQLLEAAQDELTFRTVVRDIHTKSPLSQIVLLNPNTWCYNGYCSNNIEPVAKINMYPIVKLLFSANVNDMELEPRDVEEWVTKNQADEVFMLPSQVKELITNLEMANTMLPPSHMLMQGFYMSSLKR